MSRMQVYSHEADCTFPADTLDMSVGGALLLSEVLWAKVREKRYLP